MANIWQMMQDARAAIRQLCEDVDGLRDALLKMEQDRYLDALAGEQLRCDLQRVWAEIAAVKETLRQALDEDEDGW